MKIEPEEYAEALANFLDDARKRLQSEANGDLRLIYFLDQVGVVAELARDILSLEDRNRSRGPSILLRSLFDSVYVVVAATKNLDFVIAKLIYEEESEAKRFRMPAKDGAANEREECLRKANNLEEMVRGHRESYPSVANENWGNLGPSSVLLRRGFSSTTTISILTSADSPTRISSV